MLSDCMNLFCSSYRLWICNKSRADNKHPQQIGFMNVVPRCHSTGGTFKKPEFQNFADMLRDFNERISQNPIRGIF